MSGLVELRLKLHALAHPLMRVLLLAILDQCQNFSSAQGNGQLDSVLLWAQNKEQQRLWGEQNAA
jgi:hypothetical protein